MTYAKPKFKLYCQFVTTFFTGNLRLINLFKGFLFPTCFPKLKGFRSKLVLKLSVMMMVDFVLLLFFIYQFECNQSLELFNKNSNRYDLSYFKSLTSELIVYPCSGVRRPSSSSVVHNFKDLFL